MADNFRYRRGETSPVLAPVASGTVLAVGDLVYKNVSGQAAPAASQATQGSAAAAQALFHDNFLGVASQASANGDTADVRVATEGEFEFACAAATFQLGDLVGPAASNGDLSNQTVVAVADAGLAIGRVAKHYGTNTTRVLVRIVSSVMGGGVQHVVDPSPSSSA